MTLSSYCSNFRTFQLGFSSLHFLLYVVFLPLVMCNIFLLLNQAVDAKWTFANANATTVQPYFFVAHLVKDVDRKLITSSSKQSGDYLLCCSCRPRSETCRCFCICKHRCSLHLQFLTSCKYKNSNMETVDSVEQAGPYTSISSVHYG